jgi:hypothetical protein
MDINLRQALTHVSSLPVPLTTPLQGSGALLILTQGFALSCITAPLRGLVSK